MSITTPGAAIPPANEIVTRLEKIDSFILCAREAVKATNTIEGRAASDLLLHVQNLIYNLRRALDPSIDADVSAGGAA